MMGLSSMQVSSDVIGCATTLEFPMKRQQQQQQQQQQQHLNCPRCDSTNTKFCYYNNYNKSQPRHFCKACKRHWTKGGTLRNIPVGGGRKNKRLRTSKNATKTTTTTTTTTKTNVVSSPLISGINNNTNNMTLQDQHLRASPTLRGTLNIDVVDKNFSKAFYQNFLEQQQQPCSSLQETSITFSNKGLNLLGLSQHHDNDQETQLPYSNFGSFESNPCSISSTITSIQSPILYNFTGDDHANNFVLEETITNYNVKEISSNWGWDDFDKFVSVEADLTIPWDDEDIKP